MKIGIVIRYVGLLLLLDAFFMLCSVVVSLVNGFDTGFYPLLLSFVITGIIGAFPMIFVPNESHITTKESYTIVIMSWIFSCLMGMLPYLIWGGEFGLANAWFESISGFTTTGSTILTDVEAVPNSLLFWRASTHWIGGVGVVLFALVIIPAMGHSKMSLSSAEMSTMARDNFRYSTRKILKIILTVYIGLTALETVALMLVGQPWFDAVTNSFSTMATGGFSIKNLSIMYYNSLAVEMVITVFMILAGLHMGLIYATLIGKRNNLFRSEVARFYIISLAVCTIVIAISLYTTHHYPSLGESFRYSVFQTASYMTTSGFASSNAALWPPLCVVILVFLSVQCAMAGSSTGGVKSDRILLVFKAIKTHIKKLQHPNAVIRIKQNGIAQDQTVVGTAVLLIVFYMLSAAGGTIVLTAMNIDITTSFTATIASLSNVGPGFGRVSNLENYGWMPDAAKTFLTGLMLLGRLEFFGFIHIFTLRSWK